MILELTAAELCLQKPSCAVLLRLLYADTQVEPIDAPNISILQSFVIRCDEVPPLVGVELGLKATTSWPRQLTCNGIPFIRLMDRLYLPEPLATEVMIPALNACAQIYEQLIDAERNKANIARLVDAIMYSTPQSGYPLMILDFGCGSGLSAIALGILIRRQELALFGFDNSPRMRQIATGRGILQIGRSGSARFQGIFASYVLHAHTPDVDIAWIAHALMPQGVFAANWLHGSKAEMQSVLDRLIAARNGTGTIIEGGDGWINDPILVFVAHD